LPQTLLLAWLPFLRTAVHRRLSLDYTRLLTLQDLDDHAAIICIWRCITWFYVIRSPPSRRVAFTMGARGSSERRARCSSYVRPDDAATGMLLVLAPDWLNRLGRRLVLLAWRWASPGWQRA